MYGISRGFCCSFVFYRLGFIDLFSGGRYRVVEGAMVVGWGNRFLMLLGERIRFDLV